MARHFTGPAARFPSRAHRALPRDARGCIARVCAIACILRSFRGGFPRWWRAACRQATGFKRSWLAPVVSEDFPWARRCACAVRRGVRAVCGRHGGLRDPSLSFLSLFFVTSRDILRCESAQIQRCATQAKRSTAVWQFRNLVHSDAVWFRGRNDARAAKGALLQTALRSDPCQRSSVRTMVPGQLFRRFFFGLARKSVLVKKLGCRATHAGTWRHKC